MTCGTGHPAPLRCPSYEESLAATVALAPCGPAWPVNDGGGLVARYLAWLASLAGRIPAASEWPNGYVQAGWFAAVAAVRNYLEARLCALRLEFWCATMGETRDFWMREYGLPDACDPFPDLCTKVAAIGGTRCEYYAAIAARTGWKIECVIGSHCGVSAGDPVRAKAGRARPSRRQSPATIYIAVYPKESPAFSGGRNLAPKAGRLKAGRPLACPVNLDPLKCILERIVHAEVELHYQLAYRSITADSTIAVNAPGLTADGYSPTLYV